MDIDTKMRLFDASHDRTLVDASPEDIEAAKLLLDAMAANEMPYTVHRNDTVMAEEKEKEKEVEEEEEEDEGELSDASTILLDQEELQDVYRRNSYDAAMQQQGVAESVVQNSSVAEEFKDESVEKPTAERTESPAEESTVATDSKDVSLVTVGESRADVPSPTNKASDDTSPTVVEAKKSVKKISLQEYLFNQQQKKMH